MVDCPICGQPVKGSQINRHIDSSCKDFIEAPISVTSSHDQPSPAVSSFFQPGSTRSNPPAKIEVQSPTLTKQLRNGTPLQSSLANGPGKRTFTSVQSASPELELEDGNITSEGPEPPTKRVKGPTALQKAAPLAERMRPRTFDDMFGQELVGPSGILRGLIEQDRFVLQPLSALVH